MLLQELQCVIMLPRFASILFLSFLFSFAISPNLFLRCSFLHHGFPFSSNLSSQSKAPEKDPAKENTTAAAGGGFTTASLMNGIQRTLVQPMKENEKLRAVILKNKLELNYKGNTIT